MLNYRRDAEGNKVWVVVTRASNNHSPCWSHHLSLSVHVELVDFSERTNPPFVDKFPINTAPPFVECPIKMLQILSFFPRRNIQNQCENHQKPLISSTFHGCWPREISLRSPAGGPEKRFVPSDIVDLRSTPSGPSPTAEEKMGDK